MRAWRTRWLLAPALAGLVLGGADASAGKGGVEILPVTGHTVGGPAVLGLRDEARAVWTSPVPADVCVSVSNGNRDAELELTQTSKMETVMLAARQKLTVCADEVEEVAFSCTSKCSLSWRVDR